MKFIVATMLGASMALGGCNADMDVGQDGGGGVALVPVGGDGGSGGVDVVPWDGSPYLGFGYDGSPCDAQQAFAERDTEAPASLASSPMRAPVNGFITRITVVHAIQSVLGTCSSGERRVLLSVPTDGSVPVSPAVHEEQVWTQDDVESAPKYKVPYEETSRSVELGRDLVNPVYVQAGEYVHLASVLDEPGICAFSCGAMLDDTELPTGHAHCTVAEEWIGCGPMPDPGATNYLAFVGWVDFAAE